MNESPRIQASSATHITHGTYLGTQGAGSSSLPWVQVPAAWNTQGAGCWKVQRPCGYPRCRYSLPGIPKVLGAGRYGGRRSDSSKRSDKNGISGNMGENMELPGLPKQADTHIRCKAVNSKHFSSKANRNTAYGRCSKGAQCWKVQTL